MNLEHIATLIALSEYSMTQLIAGPETDAVLGELAAAQLIERDPSEEAPWCLAERGKVFVEHLQSLELPTPVTVWKMPGVATKFVGARPRMPGPEEGAAPPAPPPPTRVPPRPIPTDPAELRALALQMMDSGFGMNETAEFLKLTPEQSQAIFYGGS